MNQKLCTECNNPIINKNNKALFCIDCSKSRRKIKMLEYGRNRKPLSEERTNALNEARRSQRAVLVSNGKCTDCRISDVDTGITRCKECNLIFKKRCTKYSRSIGFLPAGNSQYELRVFNILQSLIPFYISKNNRTIIRNPHTNKNLELDLYIEYLNIGIEVDGPMHRIPCYGQPRLDAQIINDRIKDSECVKLGIKLIRISTEDIDKYGDEFIRTTLSQAIRIALDKSSSRMEGATHSN